MSGKKLNLSEYVLSLGSKGFVFGAACARAAVRDNKSNYQAGVHPTTGAE